MKKLFFVSVAALAIAACDDGRNKNPITNVEQATADRDLQASWISECKTDFSEALKSAFATANIQDALKSYRLEYKFQGANVTRTLNQYKTADCSGDTISFREVGDFRIETDPNKKTNDGGKNIDMHFKTVTAVVTANGVDVANAIQLCGVGGWNADDEREVTGNSGAGNCYEIKVPRDVYNVYRVNADTLYLGTDPSGANTENDRPARAMNDSVQFKKKP